MVVESVCSALGPHRLGYNRPEINILYIYLMIFNNLIYIIRAVYRTVASQPKKFRAAQKFRARPKSFAGRAEKFRAAGKSVARRAPTKVSPALKVWRELINQHF